MSVAGMRLDLCAMLSRVLPGATLCRIKRDSTGWGQFCPEALDELPTTELPEALSPVGLASVAIDVTNPNSVKSKSSQRREVMLSKLKLLDYT